MTKEIELEKAIRLLKRAVDESGGLDPYVECDIEQFLKVHDVPKTFGAAYMVATESDGLETVFHGDGVVIVPIGTLDNERKKKLEDGDYEKLLSHGGEFPAIYLTEMLEALAESGKLDEMLAACRNTRERLDESGYKR